MPKRIASYRDGLLESLVDPQEASDYLQAALGDSNEAFLVALRDVAEAHHMAKVAKDAGVAREALYRMLSESGNPTLTNFSAILRSVGLKIEVSPITSSASHTGTGSPDALPASDQLAEKLWSEMSYDPSARNAANSLFSVASTTRQWNPRPARPESTPFNPSLLIAPMPQAANNNSGLWMTNTHLEPILRGQ